MFPVPGTRRIEHLEQNVAAYEISRTLTEAELAELEAAVPAHEVRTILLIRKCKHTSATRAALRAAPQLPIGKHKGARCQCVLAQAYAGTSALLEIHVVQLKRQLAVRRHVRLMHRCRTWGKAVLEAVKANDLPM